ncbi:MAG: proprotein convertase P-domain-containing protein [Bryobacteraceae bacterium]|nr:proprotein convertase P-domain-containing protein [Bryobacteraceae bacterium]
MATKSTSEAKKTSENEIYSYRAGQRVVLTKRPDQFVVRASPEVLKARGWDKTEAVSPHSTRVSTTAANVDKAMEECRNYGVTHHAYDTAETNSEFLITDRILVTFKQAPSGEELDAFVGKYALLKLQNYSERDFLFQLTDQTGMNPVKLVVQLTENEPVVEFVDHDLNQRVKRMQFAVPTDSHYLEQWHLHTRRSHSLFDRRSSSRCEGAWQLLDNFGSAEVVVCVTDDGCRLDHRDFDSTGKFAGFGFFQGNQFITNLSPGADRARMYEDGEDHGTACAGVIGAEIDAGLTVGAAPGCRLLPIKWELIREDRGEFLAISDGKLLAVLDFVADKVDVISNSWGSSPQSNSSAVLIARIRELAQTGGPRRKGIVFLWAAGNENCPIQHNADVDTPFDDGRDGNGNWVGVNTSRTFRHNLVGIPGVMYVAAVASNAQRSHYSNYGTGIDISAPSNNLHIYRRMPSITGLGITTVEGASPTTTTRSFGGTSSATPLTAGIAALVISANPDLTALEVISILKRTASKDLDFTPYPKTPPASFDPNPTWDVSPIAPFDSGAFQNINSPDGTWSPWFGHGRVDAQAAVAEALSLRRAVQPQQQVLRRSSEPALPIPDNTPAGVTNSISFTESGRVGSVQVTVDIPHAFIGDLEVALISPSGRRTPLTTRSNASDVNLRRTFTAANTPALAALNGESIAGAWTLAVADVAARDTGTLQRWEIEFSAAAATAMELEDSPGLEIPDFNPAGINRTVTVTATGNVRDVSVSVDITHDFIGDLSLTLTSPAGTAVRLKTQSGDSSDNLITTFSPANTPTLAQFRGQSMAGIWTLNVTDHATGDIGKWNRWALKIDRAS